MNNTAISANKEKLIFKNESHRKFYEEWLPKCLWEGSWRKYRKQEKLFYRKRSSQERITGVSCQR